MIAPFVLISGAKLKDAQQGVVTELSAGCKSIVGRGKKN